MSDLFSVTCYHVCRGVYGKRVRVGKGVEGGAVYRIYMKMDGEPETVNKGKWGNMGGWMGGGAREGFGNGETREGGGNG